MWRLGSCFALAFLFVAAVGAEEPPSAVQPAPPKAPGPWVPKPEKPAAAARCLTPAGDPVPADTILESLREGTNVDLQGIIIEGNLDPDRFWGPAGEGRSSLRVVRGRLRLDSCRVTGHIAFPSTVFAQDIVLSCTELGGDLDLTDSEVRGGLVAERARIGGDVRLTNAVLGKDVSFKKSALGGRLDLSGARLYGVNLQQSEIERSLDLTHAIAGATDLSLAKIDGPVKLSDALLLGAFTARDATFRALSLSSVTSSHSIDLGGSSVTGDVSLAEVSIERDLILPESFGGSLDLAGVDVGHDLSLAGSLFLDVRIKGLTVRGGSDLQRGRFGGKLEIDESDFGKKFLATGTRFAGACEFRKVRFPGNDPLAGALFAFNPTIVDTTLPRPPSVSPDMKPEPEANGSADEKH